MNIVLVHPIHGAKVAINKTEMEQDVKNGWVEYTPDNVDNVDTPVDGALKADKPVRNKLSRKVAEPPIEQPN